MAVTWRCCDATACRAAGAAALRQRLEAEVGAERVKPVGCLRLCGQGPLAAADHDDGRSELFGGVAGERRLDWAHPFFALQRPVVLERCGLVDPSSIDDALAQGAYATLAACRLRPAAELVEEVVRSGLRGRGGAGYPTGRKWQLVAAQSNASKVVVCNADEGDPGAFMDRSVMEGDPHRLLEGMAIAAQAVGAAEAYIYVRAEYPLAIERLRTAIAAATDRGVLAGLPIQLRIGAGAYVCGEETALLHSIEGGRGTPRPRPPYPAASGLWGLPTLINNVETFAAIPAILREGGDWYAAMGTAGSKGTKVFALSGAITHTGLIEVEMGTSLRTIVEAMGGGGLGVVKAVQTGGPSGGCIPVELLDTPVDYASLQQLGSIMGSGGMVVIDGSMAMPELARYFMRFCVAESCGKCLPCRAGTVQLEQLLDRFVEKRASPADLAQLEQLCGMVKATSLCGLGQSAPNPVLSTLRFFRAEYEAALAPGVVP
ncbi:NADH-ubiquinone oxidoreductase-F iron-sulfur binding region domain-containing protein [Cyanobium sp. FACHB-13342]|uniref:complex I 51 kDa subunit family protein n=1 Tax=Cyanobium sp. FACHB-13342 TaxID=2692793 RepID=UPI001681624E|nr:NADH-ubiquinone oxidoreductase-F iron-sulfur binding region domain-containing protein [Cyanobium sp. FACHB-13342]MBD2422862.1 NADH-quinone oxidoreductase subunit L [Cyanobium sp. FACHB-13342]